MNPDMIDNGPYTEMKPENGFDPNMKVKEEKHKPEYDKYLHNTDDVVEEEQPAPPQEPQEQTNEYGSMQEQPE